MASTLNGLTIWTIFSRFSQILKIGQMGKGVKGFKPLNSEKGAKKKGAPPPPRPTEAAKVHSLSYVRNKHCGTVFCLCTLAQDVMKGNAIFEEYRTVIFRVQSYARILPDEAHADTRHEMGLKLGHWEDVVFNGSEWVAEAKPEQAKKDIPSVPKIQEYKPIESKKEEPEPEFDLFE